MGYLLVLTVFGFHIGYCSCSGRGRASQNIPLGWIYHNAMMRSDHYAKVSDSNRYRTYIGLKKAHMLRKDFGSPWYLVKTKGIFSVMWSMPL